MEATRTVPADRHATEELREKTAQVRRDLQELSSVAKVAAQEKWDELRHGAADLEKGFEERVRQHPVQSILIAAGVGLVIGMLIRRR